MGQELWQPPNRFIDLSIPLRFDGPQPSAYGVPPAAGEPCESGTLVGDTRQGGSCNFERYTLIPHCNGTHTECVGHITHERISVLDCLGEAFIVADVVSVMPESRADGDHVITAGSLALPPAYEGETASLPSALIVRTLPNDESKLGRAYDENNMPPYFDIKAMELIVTAGYKHLLADLPSIDRLYDNGRLANHRIFWNVEPGSFDAGPDARRHSTITELIYVPDALPDGKYLLNLQIAPFATDAAPSRPLIFPDSPST